MTGKLSMTSAFIALVALLLGAAVTSSSAATTKTLRFTTPGSQLVLHRVDTGNKGPTLGDMLIINGPLHKKGGAIAGNFYFTCTVVKLHPHKQHCVGTFVVSGGQITSQGVLGMNPPATFALTGGTGAYQTTRGHVDIGGTRQLTVTTLHLIL